MSAVNGPVCSTDEPYGDACDTSYNWYLSTKGDSLRICENRTISNSNDSGLKGQICWDDDYVYVCIDDDTWKRSTLNTW